MQGGPLAVGTTLHMRDPFGIVQIPLHCFGNSRLKSFERPPAQFALDFSGIYCVAPVVPGAVCDIGDLCLVTAAVGLGPERIKQRADGVHDVDVGLFVPAADVVDLAQGAGAQALMEWRQTPEKWTRIDLDVRRRPA